MGNRKSSQDLDFFLSPRLLGREYETVRRELKRIIETVAGQLRYDIAWANDEVRVFLTLLNNPEELFDRSKSQGVILYDDENIVIYAVLWEWGLVRKMKRLQMEGQPQRSEDWNDVVSITNLLYNDNGGPLDVQILRQFDHTQREPPVMPQTIENLRRLSVRFHRREPFAGQQRQYWAWSGSRQRWAFIIDGTTRPQSEWPVRQGRGAVLYTDDRTWREFDFDRNDWVGSST